MRNIYLNEYAIEPITINNLDKYEDVFYCNEEYYIITNGHPATRTDCIETIEYSIDDISKNNIHNIGFCKNNEAVACLFLIEGYPCADILWLGLFLVHNKYKRKHIGSKCIKALIDSLKETSIKCIRLSVQDNNISGLSFWKHLGFSIIAEAKCENFKNLTMEYVL